MQNQKGITQGGGGGGSNNNKETRKEISEEDRYLDRPIPTKGGL